MLSLEYADIEIQSQINKNVNDKSKLNFNKRLEKFEIDAKKLNINNLRNGELTVKLFKLLIF